MSRENVDMLHQAIGLFNRRDLDGFLELVAPHMEFTPYTVAMGGGYQGRDGVRRWWQELFEVFPDWHVEPMEVRDLGGVTLAAFRLEGHGGESGTPVEQMLWQLAEWSTDGKMVRVGHYSSEAEALAACGLSE
jgi:ketosteroid isomerase-like protein